MTMGMKLRLELRLSGMKPELLRCMKSPRVKNDTQIMAPVTRRRLFLQKICQASFFSFVFFLPTKLV